jgi:hypothetical protein
MKCADVFGALNEEAGDLRAVRRHLETCPECYRKFAHDLEIEEALRNLDLGVTPVDITAEVRNSLSILNKRRTTHGVIQKWVWLIASLAAFALLIVSVPVLADLLSKAYSLTNRLDIGGPIDSAMSPAISSIKWGHLFYLMAAVLAWMAAYLWREAKRTIQ